jgi:hypothetical protein
MAKLPDITTLYDNILDLKQTIDDAIQLAEEIKNTADLYGGEIQRVISTQLIKYFTPPLKKFSEDPNTPGAIPPLITFLDSLPLKMVRPKAELVKESYGAGDDDDEDEDDLAEEEYYGEEMPDNDDDLEEDGTFDDDDDDNMDADFNKGPEIDNIKDDEFEDNLDGLYDLMSVVNDKLSPEEIWNYMQHQELIDEDENLTPEEKADLKAEINDESGQNMEGLDDPEPKPWEESEQSKKK